MTNIERINAMSIAELAEFLCGITKACGEGNQACCSCPLTDAGFCDKGDIRKWLESEVTE